MVVHRTSTRARPATGSRRPGAAPIRRTAGCPTSRPRRRGAGRDRGQVQLRVGRDGAAGVEQQRHVGDERQQTDLDRRAPRAALRRRSRNDPVHPVQRGQRGQPCAVEPDEQRPRVPPSSRPNTRLSSAELVPPGGEAEHERERRVQEAGSGGHRRRQQHHRQHDRRCRRPPARRAAGATRRARVRPWRRRSAR